jgi:hypothetical protein
MEDWKVKRVEYVNRKRGELSKAREACSEDQLQAIQELQLAIQDFSWEFNETIFAGGSANDIPIGAYTRILRAGDALSTHWDDPHTPDFYDEVMELKRWQTASEVHEEIRGFDELMSDLDELIDLVGPGKKCVSCGKKLVGRQKKLCGKKKCKDKYNAKK